ncbi:hypothetical protein B0H21DRAFT_775963 [Amylocystis lapponica]|nr:hypothetical protein B0H21DRAFT_775963 [Amylocystis lapponica]
MSVAAALQKLLPAKLPPSLASQPGNLYNVLSRYPKDGVGQRIHQTRWSVKGFEDCYWEVTRTKLKLEGTHGKAWGVLTWRGKQVSKREEPIRGGLKYRWAEGMSRSPPGRSTPPP